MVRSNCIRRVRPDASLSESKRALAERHVEQTSARVYNDPMPPLKPLSKEEAIALARGPYATTVEIAVAGSIAPFLWRERDEQSALKIRNGTVFFVSPDRPFMVTADHVYAAYLDARNKFGDFARCQIGNLRFVPEERLIARNEALDIATFAITSEEIKRTYDGKFAMSFDPMNPQVGKGVFFAGFPGRERRLLSEHEIESGIFTASTVADNVSDREISGHFDREYQVDKPGRLPSPEVYEIGGVSGGPLVTMVDSANLCYWRLGGVMTAFNTSFEIFYATRADFILPDGTLKSADV